MNRILASMMLVSTVFACSGSPSTDGGTGGSTGTGGGSTGTGGGAAGMTINVTGNVSTATWSAANTYILQGIVYVDNGAVLTIQPGTTIKGDRDSALVVTKTGQLIAEGTATQPIVFTANFPVGMRGIGDQNWGGIVMNGKADLNMPGKDNLAEGLPDEPRNRYGGGAAVDPAHKCGSLKYVRIEFAGDPLTATNELNGLTLNSCGTGTIIDYVQIHRGIDDGLELFGGSADIKHVVITGSDDDGLDWDRGWTGRGQFIVIQQLSGRGNHGIEADNWSSNSDATPRSVPVLYNVTLLGRSPETDNGTGGEGSSRGITTRVGSGGKMWNMVVANFTNWAYFVDSASSAGLWGTDLFIKNSIFYNNKSGTPTEGFQSVRPSNLADGGMPADVLDEKVSLETAGFANTQVNPQIVVGSTLTAPNFKPAAGSPALTGGATPPNDGFFDTTATFVGAIGATDWTAGWTAYPEN